ncbi:MAG: magnesium transporter CorA family protein [Hyphomicrobiales bacterium]
MECWSFEENRWQPGERPGASLRWFDLTAGDEKQLHALAEQCHLHPLAVEDCLSPLIHAPKIDDFGDYLFIVVQAVKGEASDPQLEELDVFLGKDFLITWCDGHVDEIAQTRDALQRGIAVRPGCDGLLYEVLDRVVDGILPRVDAAGERLDALQQDALARPRSQAEAYSMVEIRARAGRLRRMMTTQLLVVQRLSRGEFEHVAESNRIYFRDIYDHLVRIDMALEGVREDAEVALSTYLSSLNNRLSEVMKVLSVVTALALPATVISGIFGTNFDNVPGLHSNWGFAVMMAGMAGVALGMAYFFKRRGWF